MEKNQFSKEFVQKQIDTCRAKVMASHNDVKMNEGVIQFCEWLLSNMDFGSDQESKTQIVEVPLNTEGNKPIVLG